MDTELFDLNAPEGPAPQPETPERADEELYLDALATLRAKTMRELIALRAYWKSEVDQLEVALKAVQIANTPDKWPGGNETERATSRDKAFATNPDLIIARSKVSLAKANLDYVTVELEARSEERKATEFKLREREADQRDRELAVREREVAVKEYECSLE